MIKDSGNRTKFDSGAVRDIQEGKGRCDLLPLDIIDKWCDYGVQNTLYHVGEYLKRKGSKGPEDYFGLILDHFAAEHQVKDLESGEKSKHDNMIPLDQYKWELVLEVAKHFEEGAKKYGDRNWEKGIPCDRYIDSAVRHYCKWRAGWTDEPHDRAFIWNIVCCEWTRQQYGWDLDKPKINDNCFNDDTEITMTVEGDFSNLFDMLDIEEPKKDQDTAELNSALNIAERYDVCYHSPIEDCSSKHCSGCEYYVSPDDFNKAVMKLYQHVRKSMQDYENRQRHTADR